MSFHLYETIKGRHMFDYESAAGEAFIKDRDARLKSFEWTDTGIKMTIPDINKDKDLAEYKGEVSTISEDADTVIEVQEIIGKIFNFFYDYFQIYKTVMHVLWFVCILNNVFCL